MSKKEYHAHLILSFILAIGTLACSSIQIVLFDTPAAPPAAIPTMPAAIPTLPPTASLPTATAQPMAGLEGYWTMGATVFTIAWQDNKYVVTAMNAVGSNEPQLVSQSWDGQVLRWSYKKSSSATRIHTLVTQSLNGDRLNVQWSSSLGDSGPLILRRATSAVPVHESLPYYDDFSDPSSGWNIWENATGSIKYENGYYSVHNTKKNWYMIGAPARLFGDVVIAVDATSAGPASDYAVQVDCDAQPNEDNYRFEILSTGYYYVGIYRQGNEGAFQFTNLSKGTSSAIYPGTATNHIVTTCAGGNLSLEVNGRLLSQLSDNTFHEGGIGLGATSLDDNPTEIHFDNLSVTAP